MDKHLKVLVSDDSQEFLQQCGRAFADKGLEIISSPKDGLKLLEKIEALRPEVVLADLFMPGLDGIGVMRASASRGGKQPLFVILWFFKPKIRAGGNDLRSFLFCSEPLQCIRTGRSYSSSFWS